jgi:hypothetical protein
MSSHCDCDEVALFRSDDAASVKNLAPRRAPINPGDIFASSGMHKMLVIAPRDRFFHSIHVTRQED